MQEKISLQLSLHESNDVLFIKSILAQHFDVTSNEISGFQILKKSLDARSKIIKVNLTLNIFINEPVTIEKYNIEYKNISRAKRTCIIIGAGPAGIFCALELIKNNIKPIIIERGKDVRSRRRDLAILNKNGIVNPESNYCFGEGGAGTYSDGKLYTRSKKRGNIDIVLKTFVQFGAAENIMYEAHPHIGTNKLPQIMVAMREKIIECGGEFIFEKKLVDFTISNNKITTLKTSDGDTLHADTYVLATGHSARDIFELLYQKKILIEAKPFALGVRIEHPQNIIDQSQYHLQQKQERDPFLPAAAYSMVEQIDGRGVFSFCMCPGGIIAPAATAPGELVVNGWSPSKRDNPYANSGMVVNIGLEQINKNERNNPLALLNYQKKIEQECFIAGGNNMKAPAQRMTDFCRKIASANLPKCSYNPGLNAVDLNNVLPSDITSSLAKAFVAYGRKMKGYFTEEAVLVATESRTSSPVRIPRDSEYLTHPQLTNFYPCGEGAGYAGGIVSAAIDGQKVAQQIVNRL